MDGHRSAPNELAALLRGYRKRSNLTQRHLADLSTVSVRTIRYLESGALGIRPRIETIRLIAEGLGLRDVDRVALELAAERQPMHVPAFGDVETLAVVTPPARMNALIGREAELKALQDLVLRAGQRLVAVVGLSGVGKSRLALELAWHLRGDGVPVAWIDLACDDDTCLDAAPASDGKTTNLHDKLERLAWLSRTDEVLLVLDGLDGEPAAQRGSLWSLLSTYPDLRILLTTRDPRGFPARSTFLLPPLTVPRSAGSSTAFNIERYGALRLLDLQMRRVCPGLELDESVEIVTELCRRLDGLPTLLELAAQACLVYSPTELLAAHSQDPLSLLSALAVSAECHDPIPAVRAGLNRLESAALKLLTKLATLDGPCSLIDVADVVGDMAVTVIDDLRLLTLCGFVRRDADGLRVLNLVRRVLEEPDPPLTSGADRIIPTRRALSG